MRTLIFLVLLAALSGCNRWMLDTYMNDAYESYREGDCAQVREDLSKAERASRSRSYVQPEISLLRGQCLEREQLYVDAERTYQYIVMTYPKSEYAFRAKARLETLHQLGLSSGVIGLQVAPATP